MKKILLLIAIACLQSSLFAKCVYVDCGSTVEQAQKQTSEAISKAFDSLNSEISNLKNAYKNYNTELGNYNKLLSQYKQLKALEVLKAKEMAFQMQKMNKLNEFDIISEALKGDLVLAEQNLLHLQSNMKPE